MIWTDEAGSFTAPSGLRVEVNLVPEAWCLREVPGAELRALVEKASREMRKAGREWRSTCLAAPMTGDREEVARWLEACLAVRLDDRKGAAMAAVRLLARLRLAGMLLWPAAYAWMPRLVGTGRPGQHVGLEDGLTGFERTILEGRSCRSVPSVMLMACSPAHAIDDISAEAVTAVVCAAAGVPEASPELLLKLPRFLEGGSRTDGTDIAVVEETEKRLRALGGRWAGPSRFGAVAERDDAADWLSAFGDASARTTHKRRSGQDNAFRRLAAYFGQLDAVPRPEDLRRELHFEGPRGFKAWLREAGHPSPTYIGKILVHLSGLFEMLVEQGRMDLNPIRDDDVPAGEPRRSCSDKAEIPREVLDLIREVVRELADHAFAQFDAISDRTWKRAGKPLDGVSPKHRDAGLLPATLRRPTGFGAYGVTLRGCDGSLVRVLSPALPVIVLWLCTVANRSIEPRLADSGEADEFVPDVVVEKSDDGFDRVHAVPRPNTHPLMKVGRSEGAIRVMKQGNQSVVGLYVTSNKSQAGGHADGSDHGRAIPRQDAVLLQALEKVRTWQGALNPVDRLLSRDELREPVMQPTDGLRGKLPRYAFLFRDLRDDKLSQRLEPPNFGRLKRFFDLVLNEVEARLAGFTAGDGSLDMPEASPRIVLERDRWGQPLSCAYSLHCLRVTGLTSLMDAGVPLWIISRLVAGHASYLMTLYYRRLKPEAAMDAIAAAQRRMDEGGRRRGRPRGGPSLQGEVVDHARLGQAGAAGRRPPDTRVLVADARRTVPERRDALPRGRARTRGREVAWPGGGRCPQLRSLPPLPDRTAVLARPGGAGERELVQGTPPGTGRPGTLDPASRGTGRQAARAPRRLHRPRRGRTRPDDPGRERPRPSHPQEPRVGRPRRGWRGACGRHAANGRPAHHEDGRGRCQGQPPPGERTGFPG